MLTPLIQTLSGHGCALWICQFVHQLCRWRKSATFASTPSLRLHYTCMQMLQQHRSHVGERNASISHEACRPSTRQIRENCSCSEHLQRDQEETKGSINTKRKEKTKKRCSGAVMVWHASVRAMKSDGVPAQPSFAQHSIIDLAMNVVAKGFLAITQESLRCDRLLVQPFFLVVRRKRSGTAFAETCAFGNSPVRFNMFLSMQDANTTKRLQECV